MPNARSFPVLVALVATLGASLNARAAAPAIAAEGRAESRGWDQPAPADQLAAAERAPLPAGWGAILVPAMTTPNEEPRWAVRRAGTIVARAAPGERMPVPPGSYELLVGSDPLQTGRVRTVEVVAGETTLVEPDWAAFRVDVVDANAVPHRGAYELIQLPSLNPVGVGYGAQVELGQRLQTWIVEPGLYLLLRRGESYQARENFYTFRLRPGHVERIALVIDPDEGTFLGAGEVGLIAGRGTDVDGDLTVHWVVGGGATLDVRRSVPGTTDTIELGPSFYSDFALTWNPAPHFVYLRLKIDEEWTQEDWGTFEKDLDALRFDAIYAFEITHWIGPYARVGLETSLFPSWISFDEATTTVDAAQPGRTLATGERFRIADPVSPLTLKGGTGLRFDAAHPPFVDFWALAGVGGRQVFTFGQYAAVDDPVTAEFEVERRGWSGDFGLEATLFLEVTPLRWLLLTTEFEVFAPARALEDPTLRLDVEVGVRVTSAVGIVYSLVLERKPAVTDELQQTHSLALRFSFTIF